MVDFVDDLCQLYCLSCVSTISGARLRLKKHNIGKFLGFVSEVFLEKVVEFVYLV